MIDQLVNAINKVYLIVIFRGRAFTRNFLSHISLITDRGTNDRKAIKIDETWRGERRTRRYMF